MVHASKFIYAHYRNCKFILKMFLLAAGHTLKVDHVISALMVTLISPTVNHVAAARKVQHLKFVINKMNHVTVRRM